MRRPTLRQDTDSVGMVMVGGEIADVVVHLVGIECGVEILGVEVLVLEMGGVALVLAMSSKK